MRNYLLFIAIVLSQSAIAQEFVEDDGSDFDLAISDKNLFTFGSEVNLDRYSWIDVAKIAAISVFDPSVLTETRFASTVSVANISDEDQQDALWQQILEATKSAPSLTGFSSTGYAVAVPTENNAFTLNDLRCDGSDCSIYLGIELSKISDLPTGSLLVSPNRREFDSVGGFTVVVSGQDFSF